MHTVIITQKRLAQLLKLEVFYHALEAAGVDNWSGWGEQEDTEEEENAIDAAAEAGTLTPDGPTQ